MHTKHITNRQQHIFLCENYYFLFSGKSDSKDIYNIIKYLYFKLLLF